MPRAGPAGTARGQWRRDPRYAAAGATGPASAVRAKEPPMATLRIEERGDVLAAAGNGDGRVLTHPIGDGLGLRLGAVPVPVAGPVRRYDAGRGRGAAAPRPRVGGGRRRWS